MTHSSNIKSVSSGQTNTSKILNYDFAISQQYYQMIWVLLWEKIVWKLHSKQRITDICQLKSQLNWKSVLISWNHIVYSDDLTRCSLVCNLLLTSNLVSHSLGLNDSDVINDSLVEVEILGHPNINQISR